MEEKDSMLTTFDNSFNPFNRTTITCCSNRRSFISMAKGMISKLLLIIHSNDKKQLKD